MSTGLATGPVSPAAQVGWEGGSSIAKRHWPLIVLLVAQAGLIGWSAAEHSPAIDEVGHLGAGLHHWKTGTFDLYRVNPPLVRLVATAPLALAGVEPPYEDIDTSPPNRPEFGVGRSFVSHHADRAFWYFTVARWACLPFALLATAIIYLWSSSLYGRPAGVLSAFLWVVCPSALANGQMITPDTAAAAFGVAACYLFWRWLRSPSWALALSAGAVLGVAELSKTTWILLGPVWVAAWVIYRFRNPVVSGPRRKGQAAQLAAGFLAALCVLNAGFGFEGTGTRLGQLPFVSQGLTAESGAGRRVNRFAGTPAAHVPVPLPRNYISGIDVQKRDFEVKMRSYLRGEWRTGGWWYYYLYGLLVKTPLGTLLVFGMAAASYLLRRPSTPGWRDEVVLLLPAVAVLALVSSQTGFNHHVRYVLPALPFLFVWAGRAVAGAAPAGRWLAAAAAVAAATSSLVVYPHSMSYFNEAAGGPLRGSEHLLDSNSDWGQDLLYLKKWYDANPDARPLGLVYFGAVDPRAAGIEFSLPPKGPVTPPDLLPHKAGQLGPHPGWYAVSTAFLRGSHYSAPDGRGGIEQLGDYYFHYFLRFRPVAYAGYSIWIYHLDRDECNRVRAELGLPLLAGDFPTVGTTR
jgi:4-amino-4-deoxy-L-arabinose transferase-like glycosyltransferase